TIFSTPKPFKGHIGIIQRNAITSWTLIKPRPEIILFGSDAGTAEVARELGVRHESEIATNQYGTPLLNDLFLRAETYSQSQTMCYVNTDILLFSRFKRGVDQVSNQLRKFLLCCIKIMITVMCRAEPTGSGKERKQNTICCSTAALSTPARFWMLHTSSGIPETSSESRFEGFGLIYGSGLFIIHSLFVVGSVFAGRRTCLPNQEPVGSVDGSRC
ncbi:MAG: hypothetical protein DMG54_36035, partial [Acidobacteria bacterium]